MAGIDKTNNLEQQQSGENNSLDDYLNSELKLQSEIDKKLQDPELQDIARQELEEIKTRFQESLNKVHDSTSQGIQDTSLKSQSLLGDLKNNFVLQDLVDDFRQDSKALNNLEENYKDKKGYKEFIQLLKSDSIGEQTKEQLYTIFSNQDVNKKLISRNLRKGFPLDQNNVDKFINNFTRGALDNEDNIQISEILNNDKELESYSLNELIYMKDKLISLTSESSYSNKDEINQKLAGLDINISLKVETEAEEQKLTEKEQTKTEKEQTKININEEISKLKELIPLIKDFPFEDLKDKGELKNHISRLEEAETNEGRIGISKDIAKSLVKGDMLKQIMDLAQKKGGENYNNIYNFISQVAIISENTDLNKKILKYKPKEISITQIIDPIELSGYLGNTGNVLKVGDKYIQGDMLIDMSGEPPRIDVFNQNTGYTLNIENIHSEEIQQNAVAKQKVYGEMLDLKREEYSIKSEIEKSNLLLQNPKQLEEISKQMGKTVDELKTEIVNKLNGLKEDLNNVQKEYVEKRQIYIDLQDTSFAEDLKEQKEKQRDVLKYLNAIGFDLIPQSVTDQFMRELEMNTIQIPGLNLNAKTIDLKEGRFGESETEANGDKWKDNLLKFTEKMIYGEVNPEDSIFRGKNFKGEMAASINPVDFYGVLDAQGLRTNTGWNINTLRDNLRKPVEK